jgi:DNA-binding LacI/PurR family transcriptional regulator
MTDVAARAGVSRQLVSMIFRNAPGPSPTSRARVFAAAHELGYSPDRAAQMLRRKRSAHLGVLFTLDQPFDLDLVEHLYPVAEAAGYDVVLSAMTPIRQERQAVEQLIGYRSEALILLGPDLDPDRLSALAKRVAIVEFGRRMVVDGVDAVRTDDVEGVRFLVDHLVELGHRAIVHVDGGDMPGAEQRRTGYRQNMDRHGLQEWIRVLPGDYTEESGASAARRLLSEDRLPSAIIAGNDRCAVGVMEIMIRAGLKIPQDVSIVGYDDSHISRLSYVDLTTVRQDINALAQQVIDALVERLERRRTSDRDIVVSPQLVVRSSAAPPRMLLNQSFSIA